MAAPSDVPCDNWIEWDDLPCEDVASQIDDTDVQDLILGFVTGVLWNLSCQKYGLCSVTVRPCRVGSVWQFWSPSYYGAVGMLPIGAGGCQGCRARTSIELPALPVASVTEVKVDGVVIDTGDYRVDQWRDLVRLDGDRWPTFQNLQLADTEVGTWSVTETYGVAVPAGGILAAKLYACEVAKGWLGQDCALPPGTTSASRDGVTVNIIDTAEAVASGKTGVLLVDLWLQTVCPGGPGKAMSGGMDPGRRRGRAIQVDT